MPSRPRPLSSHHAHPHSLELTVEEFDRLRAAADGTAFGVPADTERTFLEITTFERIHAHDLAGWATPGMPTQALTGR